VSRRNNNPSIFYYKLPIIGIAILVGFYIYFIKSLYNLPPPETLTSRQIEVSTKIYDRNGELLYALYKDENRSLLKPGEAPQHVILATLAAEDSEFYSHFGFSTKGIARAVIKFAKTRKVTGGSTITQQLVKNALLTSERTFTRKFKEIVLALGVEHKYSKNEIMTMYLNEVNYGGAVYGIKEASRFYFDKQLADLTIAEAALLAGLTKSPTHLSPFGVNTEMAKKRQMEILDLMRKNGFLTDAQLEKEKSEELKLSENKIDIKAPHFVMYVVDQLNEKYGEDYIKTSGLEVHTTLDISLQEYAQEIVKTEVERLGSLNVKNGASVIVDPKTGEILAMVGSIDYFNTEIDGNVNVTTRLRQPGSSIKPINYALALSKGMTPATVIEDKPTVFKVNGQEDYVPKNYDSKFRGSITLRSALAESRNIPAVRILAQNSVDEMISLGEKMGITTWEDRSRFGLSLTLGGGEVRLIDLTQVYQVLANNGKKTPLFSISKIVDTKGKTVYKPNCSKTSCQPQVVDSKIAYLITNILSDNRARTPSFGSYSALVVRGHPEVAVKTGTSNNLRDNLTLGYNQDYLVSVWVGNNDNSPMSRVASGVTGASQIWNKIMTTLVADSPPVAWSVPDGLAKLPVCTPKSRFTEWFVKGTEPKSNCFTNAEKKHAEALH